VRLSLRVIVIVFNDAALSLIKIKQKLVGHGGDDELIRTERATGHDILDLVADRGARPYGGA